LFCLDGYPAPGKLVAEHPDARAAIQNEASSARRRQFDARRVAAISRRRLIHRGRRAANSPEPDLCCVAWHLFVQCAVNFHLPGGRL
jgi:hypothetical protein